MIVRTFRKSFLLQYILLVLLHLLLWGGAFISPPSVVPPASKFLNPGFSLLTQFIGNSPLLMVVLAFLLVLTAALALNYILEKNGISETNSLIPGFILILIMSLFPALQTLHQTIIPGFLMIIVLGHVFDILIERESYLKTFNSGFYIAISSFFYFPAFIFILFVWLTFIVYRIYIWREWIIVIFGFLTPYLLLWTYFFWIDELPLVFEAYTMYFSPKVLFSLTMNITILNYFSLGLTIILFLRAFFIQIGTLHENIISIRKFFWSVIMFFIVSLFSFLFSGELSEYHIVFIQVTFAIVIQGLMFRINRFLVTELMIGLLLVMMLINNYYTALQAH